jgi:hypothetical protein
MRGRGLAMLAAVILFFPLAGNAQAGMNKISVDIFTTNFTNTAQQQLCVWLTVSNDAYWRGPDFVKGIRVTAPDGSIFRLDPKKDWLPYDRAYWKAFYATDFVSQTIPGGTYLVRVTPLSGEAIEEADTITASFLPTPTVTSPIGGATGVTATPTITWTAVPGATYYRVLLWNNSWNEPVYWTWEKQARTDFTNFTISAGDLKPNCQYKLRIEARSESQDMDMRSRSGFITFTTGSW